MTTQERPIASLQDYLERRFGVRTREESNPLIASAGTSVAQLLRADPMRIAFTVINLSANTLFLGWFADVSSSKGIRLDASGGAATFVPEEDFSLIARDWHVVASGASSALFVQQLIIIGQ